MATVASPSVEDMLAGVEKKFGFVPNVVKEMSKSPALLAAYLQGQGAMRQATLSARDQQAVQLTISHHNKCTYCLAAHGAGLTMAGGDGADIEAIKAGKEPRDPRLAALFRATKLMLDKQGFLSDAELGRLQDEGITRESLYEIIALIGLKVMTNYTNHIGHTALDPQFGG